MINVGLSWPRGPSAEHLACGSRRSLGSRSTSSGSLLATRVPLA